MKWEYKLAWYPHWEEWKDQVKEYAVYLNSFGELGWELFAIHDGIIYFKRPKEDYGEEEKVEEAQSEEDTDQPQRVSTIGELYNAAYIHQCNG